MGRGRSGRERHLPGSGHARQELDALLLKSYWHAELLEMIEIEVLSMARM